MAGGQENAASRLTLPNDMAGCRSAQDTILTDKQLLDTVRSTNLGNQLHDFGVPVSTVTANDQEAAGDTFWDREKDARDERFAVMRLLENHNLLPQTRAARSSVFSGGKDSGWWWGLLDVRSRLLVGEGFQRDRVDAHGFNEEYYMLNRGSMIGLKENARRSWKERK